MEMPTPDPIDTAKRIFRRHGGTLRTSEALAAGIHRRTLYSMRDSGILTRLDRGLYRLAEMAPPSDPDLLTVARKVPKGVVCLISALHVHGLTTQIPHAVSIALPRGAEPPRLEFPPIHVYWFSGDAYSSGIETRLIEKTEVQVYSTEKTLADCFKYRNKIGMDVTLEALDLYRTNRKPIPTALLKYARICRVEKVMRPYLEVTL